MGKMGRGPAREVKTREKGRWTNHTNIACKSLKEWHCYIYIPKSMHNMIKCVSGDPTPGGHISNTAPALMAKVI